MKKRDRIMLVVALAVTLVTLLVVAAPSAFAGQVTKIQNPQQSVDTYEVTMPARGTVSARLEWTDLAGNPIAGWPTSEIDLEIQGDGSGGPYSDLSDKTWYSGLNPLITGTVRCNAGETFWISVMPWVGDLKYTLWIYNNGTALAGYPKTGTAYGAGGEIFVPSNGLWASCVQWWAGQPGSVYACWNDYVYERVPGAIYDTLSEAYVDTFIAPQPLVRATVGGGGNPQPNKWYTVAPEIWPSAANVGGATVDWPTGAQYPKPGSLAAGAAGATAWYTYTYPDDAVTGNPVAYTLGTLNNAQFSRRNCAVSNTANGEIRAWFTGTSAALVYAKTAGGGTASVMVDGVEKGPLEMYASPNQLGQTFPVTGLTAGTHEVVIKSLNPTKPTGSTGWTIYVDAIVASTDAADPTPVSENNLDGNFTYKWATIGNAGFSGGKCALQGSSSATAAFSFVGTSLEYKYAKTPAGGLGDVYIDGVYRETINFYSNPFALNQVATYSGLSNELHTFFLKNKGTANPPATGTIMYVDAFRVNGADPWIEE